MSQVAISGNASGTGTLTIAAPNTNSNYTLTLPTNTGTLISTASTFAGTGPAFSATITSSQTLSSGVNTKITFNSEEFDTASCYDPTTNYRFTPNVAGYYQVNIVCNYYSASTNINIAIVSLYKNGSSFKTGTDNRPTTNLWSNISAVYSGVVYLNGSTDYLEAYAYVGGTSPQALDASRCQFSAALVRSA